MACLNVNAQPDIGLHSHDGLLRYICVAIMACSFASSHDGFLRQQYSANVAG